MVVAIITGLLFNLLVKNKILPANSARQDLPKNFHFWSQAKLDLSNITLTPGFVLKILMEWVKASRLVMSWILFGELLTSLMRIFLSTKHFKNYFGPTLLGLGLTIFFATIIEICSEGSTPIAADILTRVSAPGNSFAF
jgi:uncharacterized membrane protein YraQ (UPF0718 family)